MIHMYGNNTIKPLCGRVKVNREGEGGVSMIEILQVNA
jgi:hypothetical protein